MASLSRDGGAGGGAGENWSKCDHAQDVGQIKRRDETSKFLNPKVNKESLLVFSSLCLSVTEGGDEGPTYIPMEHIPISCSGCFIPLFL